MPQFQDSSLLELAEQISTRAKAIHEYVEKHHLSQPSLLKDDSRMEFLENGDAEIQRVREELRSAAQQLDALAAGKSGGLIKVTENMHDANTHRLLWYYSVPRHVPSEGSISYKELAQKSGLDEDKLTRIVRYALTSFVFVETAEGQVAHSALSRLLLDDKAWAWYGHMAEDCYGTIARTAEAFSKWGSSATAFNHTGLQLYLKTENDLFRWMQQHAPERIPRFAGAMEFATEATIASVFGWDWSSLGKATMVDLGGSVGQKSIAIAQRAPQLTCIVQDLPETVAKALKPPADVAARVSFEPQDFFTPQRRSDMDVVFMARVMHDWPDADCGRILQNLVPSMKPGCRLILNEFIKMPPYVLPAAENRMTRCFDLHMMAVLNARERSLDEWKTLITKGSDGKLKFEWSTSGLVSFVKQ